MRIAIIAGCVAILSNYFVSAVGVQEAEDDLAENSSRQHGYPRKYVAPDLSGDNYRKWDNIGWARDSSKDQVYAVYKGKCRRFKKTSYGKGLWYWKATMKTNGRGMTLHSAY